MNRRWLGILPAELGGPDMEIWDIYTIDGTPTGRTHVRGAELAPGDYHLVVLVWVATPDGRFLVTKRHQDKAWPGLWECTGGSAVAGEGSLLAAVRELEEETGLRADPALGRVVDSYVGDDSLYDVWLFVLDAGPSDIRLQERETVAARFLSPEAIRAMFSEGAMVPSLARSFDAAVSGLGRSQSPAGIRMGDRQC
ncbi:MAG TPA: NUDIX domain-containing protein [Spirochaetales bacterium]|nr:NUDIX domain-containing protein [Spirochaetales bacterium]